MREMFLNKVTGNKIKTARLLNETLHRKHEIKMLVSTKKESTINIKYKLSRRT